MDKDDEAYLKSLNDKEKKAYKIAKDFLKTSFDIKKSLGYKEYMNKKKLQKSPPA